MTIRFDDTIVHAKDKIASVEFFAEIFQLDGAIWQPKGRRMAKFETVPIGELKHRLPAKPLSLGKSTGRSSRS